LKVEGVVEVEVEEGVIDRPFDSLCLSVLSLSLFSLPVLLRMAIRIFLTVTSSVTRTASLPRECSYLTTQRATRGLFLFSIDVVDDDDDVNFDDAASSPSVDATRRLALAEKTSQSSKRTM